jgi:hypothetical protein
MWISLLAYQTFLKFHKQTQPTFIDTLLAEKAKEIYSGLKPAPPLENLVEFGGSMTRDEFSRDFIGVYDPEKMTETMKPYVQTSIGNRLAFHLDNDCEYNVQTKTLDSVEAKRIIVNHLPSMPPRKRVLRSKNDQLVLQKPIVKNKNTLIDIMNIKIKKK